MGKVELEEETIDAVGYGIRGIETGRRVGWAKAFDAMRRADSAERDINMIRSDIRLLGNFAARAYGALEQTLGNSRLDELFRGDNHELKSYMPEGPLNAGRDAMRRMLGKQLDEMNKRRQHVTALKSEEYRLHDKAFERARAKELERLMDEFGIPSEEELLAHLAQYRAGGLS